MERPGTMVSEFDYGLPARKTMSLIYDVLLLQCIPERRYGYKG